MGLDNAMDISMSGILASRLQMELIASNVANAQTTRTPEGGPYQRKMAVFQEVPLTFSDQLKKVTQEGGVRLAKILLDPSPGEVQYQPNHPDANAEGFVTYPNVSLVQEMTDLVWVNHLYGANVQAMNASRRMGQAAMQLLQ